MLALGGERKENTILLNQTRRYAVKQPPWGDGSVRRGCTVQKD